MATVRLSQHGLRVLRLMLQERKRTFSGAEIAKAIRIGSGTLYPLLVRLDAAGWLSSRWENVDPHEAGRPRRRLYRLTVLGAEQAREALSGLQLRSGPS